MSFDPLPLVKILGRGLGGAGTNKHLAGVARIAIILLAMNSQQYAQDNQKILERLTEIEVHIEQNSRRITFLENQIQVAYDTALKATQPFSTKNSEARNEHPNKH